MRVTRLEVFGFKSFMERLVLPLDGGITGVVGPNGCGKSNIVDAIRWVLGETRAKNLRGEVLEDVIFNGTDKLRPLGLAEVTVTLRASGQNFFSDLQSAHDLEVELGEILESSQPIVVAEDQESQESSEEASENLPSGRPHLTVIEGNLGARKDQQSTEAETGLDAAAVDQANSTNGMPTLATRFGWLKNVSEVQVTRRLYRSGESEFFINRVACRLRDIKELFRATGIGARANTVVAQGEVARVVTAKAEERRLILEEAAGVLGFREKIAASSRKLEETALNIARLEDIIKEVSRQVSILKRQAARAQNRQELKEQIGDLDKKLARDRAIEIFSAEAGLRAELQDLLQEEANAEAALQRLQAEEHDIRNEMMGLDIQGDSLRLRIDSIREELGNRARMQSDRRSRLSELQALTISSLHQLEKLNQQEALLKQRAETLKAALLELELNESSTLSEIKTLSADSDQKLVQLNDELQNKRRALTEQDQILSGLREELAAAHSSLEVIEQEIASSSPFESMKEMGEGILQSLANSKLLAESLRVPERYTKAVQAILGEKAGFLLLDQPHQIAEEFLSSPHKNESHRPFGALRKGDAPLINRKFNMPFPALLELVEIEPEARAAVNRMLAAVFVAESASEALQAIKDLPFASDPSLSSCTIVTLEGELITPHSFQSLPSQSGLLQLMRRAQDLHEKLTLLKSKLQTETTSHDALLEELRIGEEAQRELLNKAQEAKNILANLSTKLGNIRGQLSAEKKSAEQLEQDRTVLAKQTQELSLRLDELRQSKEALTHEISDSTPQDESALGAEVERLSQEYQAIDQNRKGFREKLSGFSNGLASARDELDRCRAQSSDKKLGLQKLSLESDNLRERLSSEFEPEICEEILSVNLGEDRLPEEEALQMREELQRLKARIVREGDVDPSSIQRYAEENSRLDELNRQRDDLTQAASTLKHTIERLTETSKQRFLDVFQAVRENFIKLVPRLFGGGKGSIDLVDPTRPLETGVEINVRPPGKKLKNIDLLSGGEKALAATALIFAMFMERPSPLCVLDEVDAPLDDANLIRFLTLIREMSSRTQFLMITHNKQSMALADNLVGVTMQEPGASKVIMVSLNEAMSQVA